MECDGGAPGPAVCGYGEAPTEAVEQEAEDYLMMWSDDREARTD